MREIKEIIIHCSGTSEGEDFTVEDIDRWHRDKGWKGCGYHYVIYRDGSVHTGRPENETGAHCYGHNKHSIGVCYIGGLTTPPTGDQEGIPADTRTPEQKTAMKRLIVELKNKYNNAKVLSHHTINPHKACPCFDADGEFG